MRKITLDGVVTTLARGLLTIPPDDPFFDDGGFNDMYGLTVDAHGTVFVAYHGNRRLLQVTPDGSVSDRYHAAAPWSPMGVAAAGDDLYILETGWLAGIGHFGPRLRKRSPDGTFTTVLTLGNVDTGKDDESPDALGDGPRRRADADDPWHEPGPAQRLNIVLNWFEELMTCPPIVGPV